MTTAFFYLFLFLLGILSMGFQLLGSRLLNPHFGSSIIVWAWLISTFLLAFSAGSMLGGFLSKVEEGRANRLRWLVALLAVLSLAFTAVLGRLILDRLELAFENPNVGLLLSCAVLFFVPVTMLSVFGPVCVHHMAKRGTLSGVASGLVYSVSTFGNIAGVMLTAFVLIPNFAVSTLLYIWLGTAIVCLGGLQLILRQSSPKSP